MKNINEALGFDKPDVYLPGKAINSATTYRPWGNWYQMGIIASVVGIALIVYGVAKLGA